MTSFMSLLLVLACGPVLAQGWMPVAPMADGFRSDHSFGFAFNDVGYIVAGQTASGYSDAFYSYDAATDTWMSLDDFPGEGRGYAIGDTWDGKAWFGFGRGNSGMLNDLWVFDPTDGSWTEKTSCPCSARQHPAFVAIDDKIYMGLGNSDAGDLNDWWEYDMILDSWSPKPSLPAMQRHHPYQFGIDGKIYTGFGHHSGEIFNEWYQYNPATVSWTEMATLPSQGRVAGTQFSHQGMGYALSGDGEGHTQMATGEFWQYDPVADEWNQWPAHPGMSRWAPASFIINDEVYLINGMSIEPGTFDYMGTNWKFSLLPTEANDIGVTQYLGDDVICGDDPQQVSASMTNWGSDTLTETTLNLVVDGNIVLQETWTGVLASYQSVEVDLGTYPFATPTDFSIELADSDSNADNDILTASIVASPSGTTQWQIALATDYWGGEVSWKIQNAAGTTIESVGTNTYANSTLYEFNVSIPSTGCYTFVLMDSYGDGMIGGANGAGSGSCSITSLDDNGNPLETLFAYDGSFSYSEITAAVDVSTVVTVNETAENSWVLQAYPNPCSDFLTISWSSATPSEAVVCDVYNAQGALIHQASFPARGTGVQSERLNSSEWPSGLYLIQMQVGEATKATQVIKH